MLIEEYDLELFTPPCEPGAERFSARARLRIDIREVLPYLNAVVRGAIYHPGAPALTWKEDGHTVAVHPYEVLVSEVQDRESAQAALERVIERINRLWERRDEITPSYETRRPPTPMEVFQLLPQTNCRACGEPTCFTFALKLVAAQRKPEDCPPLLESRYAEQLAALRDLLLSAPART